MVCFVIWVLCSMILPSVHMIQEGIDFWRDKGKEELQHALNPEHNTNIAKNVIIFMGDGMGLTTITTSRIYAKGEAGFLAWEKFHHVGLLKTYSNNKLGPDSCSTATALFCGVKINHKTSGVDGSVNVDDCEASLNPETHTPSILSWAIQAGKSTGFVTTTRVTHATPSALYAHTPNRNWESEATMPPAANKCKDIARQLIEDWPGRDINLIMGGGRQMLVSNSTGTPEDPLDTWSGQRSDGRNLMNEWEQDKKLREASYGIVSNNEELEGLEDSREFVLGIFANGHMKHEYRRDKGAKGMPSLKTMTEKAIKVLRKNEKGYVLVIEGGLIDLSHHRGHARQALDETKAFSDAVEGALSMVDTKDTLVIVTSDHSHSLSFVAYPDRNKSIFGMGDTSKPSKIPYTTLLYSVGGRDNFQMSVENGTISRRNPLGDETDSFEYSQQTGIVSDEPPHSGTDVLIFATGPMSHLVNSVREQTFVAYLVSYAANIGPSARSKAAVSYSCRTFTCLIFLSSAIAHFR